MNPKKEIIKGNCDTFADKKRVKFGVIFPWYFEAQTAGNGVFESIHLKNIPGLYKRYVLWERFVVF